MAEFRLDEVCSSVVDCEHKTVPEVLYGSAWAVGTAAMSDGRIDFSRAKRISDETYDLWTRRAVPCEGDLILAREAPVGPVVRVPASPRVALGQRTVLLRPRQDVIDSRYLHFLLMSSEMQHLMHSKSEGSTVRHLNVEDVRALPLPPLPALLEQRAIVDVLGAIDDKIESNRRQHALIERILETTYRNICANFSGEFQAMGNIVEQGVSGVWGSDVKQSESEVCVTCLRGVDLHALALGEIPSAPLRWVSAGQSNSRIPQEGEIWVEASGFRCGRSVVIGSHTNVLFAQPVRNSNFVKRLVPKISVRDSYIAWLALKKVYASEEINNFRTGTSIRNLDVEGMLKNVRVPILDDAQSSQLEDMMQYLLSPSRAKETSSLESLRDTLLPELLSGRLRVKDAELMMENV